ncbi:MAG: proline--tRNA ligase, partial [Candidatus Sericytochromatia bacterium]
RKALQAGTSHNLGTNFSKAFEVTFQDRDGQLKNPYSTSWGVSTRLIGALIMAHSDDQGLILPPKLAQTQVVIVPIARNEEEWGTVLEAGMRIRAELREKGIGVKLDDDTKQKPGWKFAEYELLGIPLRIELGPRDLAAEQVVLARRDNREKLTVPMAGLADHVEAMLNTIQEAIYEKALKFRDESIFTVNSYDELKEIIAAEKGWVRTFWDGDPATEARVKEETKATIRCIPFEQPQTMGTDPVSGQPAKHEVLYAKAY